ncbi:MAG: hypothetical protein ACREVH_03775 [Gammaproteobacteria bacterium]
MGKFGMLIPVLVACIGLYGLYWARKEEVVQPAEGVSGDEGTATADVVTEIEPAAGIEGDATVLNSEERPEGIS